MDFVCPAETCNKRVSDQYIIHINNGSDNIDNLRHADVKCPFCSQRFNVWLETKERIQAVFGSNYHLYF